MKDTTASAHGRGRGGVTLLGPAEWDSYTDEEPQGWLVSGVLPSSGPSLLVGLPMAGKSTLAAGLSVAVATGQPFAGHQVERGRTAWLFLDRPRVSGLRDLFNAVSAGFDVDAHEARPWLVPPSAGNILDDEERVRELRDRLDELEVSFVVVDSMRRASTGKENDSDDVSRAMRALATLSSGGRRAVLGLHHQGKRARGARGSGDYEAAAESVLEIKGRQGRATLTCRHHGAAEQSLELRLERPTPAVLRFVPGASGGRAQQLTDTVRSILAEQPELGIRGVKKALRERGVAAGSQPVQDAVRLVRSQPLEAEAAE